MKRQCATSPSAERGNKRVASTILDALPADASDIVTLKQARAEIVASRASARRHGTNVKDWRAVMQKAKDEKTGWAIWNDKVLLSGASFQYGKPITLDVGDSIPFNETKEYGGRGGADHWFQIPLNSPTIRDIIGVAVPGLLFTTRMPRALDLKPDESWPGIVKDKHRQQGRTERSYFEEHVKTHSISHVFVLVEHFEMEMVASTSLFKFYESLGVQVHHTPIEDFTSPAFEIEEHNINDLNVALMEGGNCLIHCMGGTGRTGTVLVGAVQNLGVHNAAKFCRRIKSTCVETLDPNPV
jgi:protein-tyrosine phosphatase